MNYVPNKVAQGLKSQRTGMIGHILPTAYPNPFFANIAQGVDHEALENDYHVLSLYSYGNAEREAQLITELASRMVDGIVITQACSKENVKRIVKMGLPVVMIERQFNIPGIEKVLVDTYNGAYSATMELIRKGHVSVGFIGKAPEPDPHSKVEMDRYQGYLDAMKDAGLVRNPHQVILMDDYIPAKGYEAMKNMLESSLPTAIFVASDMLAVGVLQCLYDHEIRVPRDVSLIGFDNTYSDITMPPLSTVALPMQEMGKTAVQLIMNRIENPSSHLKNVTLHTSLIERHSVADLNLLKKGH